MDRLPQFTFNGFKKAMILGCAFAHNDSQHWHIGRMGFNVFPLCGLERLQFSLLLEYSVTRNKFSRKTCFLSNQTVTGIKGVTSRASSGFGTPSGAESKGLSAFCQGPLTKLRKCHADPRSWQLGSPYSNVWSITCTNRGKQHRSVWAVKAETGTVWRWRSFEFKLPLILVERQEQEMASQEKKGDFLVLALVVLFRAKLGASLQKLFNTTQMSVEPAKVESLSGCPENLESCSLF